MNSIESEKIRAEYGEVISPRSIDGADVIACTLNETSTGVMIDQIPETKSCSCEKALEEAEF